WLYPDFTNGGSDFSQFDALIASAHRYGIHLFPALEEGNSWGIVNTSCVHQRPAPNNAWYASGYLSPYAGFPLSYKQYVQTVVTRYRGESAIFAWQLMNEPRDGDAPCDAAFYTFFSDMTSAIRGWDPNHLINSGTGTIYDPGFNCGTSPDTYRDIYSLPNNNFSEFHDYN